MSEEDNPETVEKFDKAMRPEASADGLEWHSPREESFYIAGFAWYLKDGAFRRMPKKTKRPLPAGVDFLANNTAGAQIRFQTNSTKLSIRVKLTAPAGMVHMPATGQCGFDCYIGPPTRQRYLSSTKYDVKAVKYDCALFDLPNAELRNITLNFPLFQGVEDVELGIDPGSELVAPPPYAIPRPVVIYGTSITQGGCASRPGMLFTNILSRKLNVEFINLGFSGSGKGEPEVAETIAEIDNPAMFVIDNDGNVPSVEDMKRTLPDFIRILREAHPDVPILVISRIRFAGENFYSIAYNDRIARRDFQHQTVMDLRHDDAEIFFFDGADLLGRDFDECTVDGVHPTDLGFQRIAAGLEPVFRTILGVKV